MNPEILAILACPECGAHPLEVSDSLACPDCEWQAPIETSKEHPEAAPYQGVPIFTSPPAGMALSEKIERGPEKGTPWRRANWRFLQETLADLDPSGLILDVGAGRGDFAEALTGRPSIALDVYPYPEVDIVCDLTQANPFRPESLDAVMLLNVLEHIYDTHTLMAGLAKTLKPGGVLIVAIPFMVKIHQAPIDYVRYTQFALQQLGEQHGLQVEKLEGYYDPVFFLGEGIGNLRWSVVPRLSSARKYPARLALGGIQLLAGILGKLVGPGKSLPTNESKNLAPTGYHVIYRKPA